MMIIMIIFENLITMTAATGRNNLDAVECEANIFEKLFEFYRQNKKRRN